MDWKKESLDKELLRNIWLSASGADRTI